VMIFGSLAYLLTHGMLLNFRILDKLLRLIPVGL